MSTVADFVSIHDASFRLSRTEGTAKHFTFAAPGFAGPPAILMLRVDPHDNAIELRVHLNDVEIMNQVFNTEPQRSWHEVISGRALAESENELVVSVPSDTSIFNGIDVSDVVILYQVAVGVAPRK